MAAIAAAAVSTVGSVVQNWLTNEKAEDENRTKVDLAVVEATGQIGRLLALTYLFGGDAAVAVGLAEVEAVTAYKTAMAEATPAWEAAAKKAAIFGMWGGSERAISRAGKARARKRAKDKPDTNTAGEDTDTPASGPAARGA